MTNLFDQSGDDVLADILGRLKPIDLGAVWGTPEEQTALDTSLGLPAPTVTIPAGYCADCDKPLRPRYHQRITGPQARNPDKPRYCQACAKAAREARMRAAAAAVTERDIENERRCRETELRRRSKRAADPRGIKARADLSRRMGLGPDENPADYEVIAADRSGVTFRRKT